MENEDREQSDESWGVKSEVEQTERRKKKKENRQLNERSEKNGRIS